MIPTSKKILQHEPGDVDMLLPWYAAGTLDARQARRVEEALVRDAGLARQYAVIQLERAEITVLNESLGAPSVRAMQRLFAAIDAEQPGRVPAVPGLSAPRVSPRTLAARRLSPRTMAWVAGLAVLVILIQAGLIGILLVQ